MESGPKRLRMICDRLQNSPYFCVFKYAWAVEQKVWNEAENRERDRFFPSRLTRPCEARAVCARKTLTPRLTDFFTDFEEKTDCCPDLWKISKLLSNWNPLNLW